MNYEFEYLRNKPENSQDFDKRYKRLLLELLNNISYYLWCNQNEVAEFEDKEDDIERLFS